MAGSADPNDESQQETFISHLIELRERLVKAVAGVIIVFLAMVYWAPQIFNLFAAPLPVRCPRADA
jgi:sec-independent protein translocase protein TatC